ncbi:MAG: hypothetical protein LDL44_13730 [Caenispirillum sp.]|nr:hypothetical protein [Caenispirillum sp.]
MPGTPTAHHALNLFSLTMESRHGCDWKDKVAPHTVALLADEIVLGFGAEPLTPTSTQSGGSVPTVWRFPDGSSCRTGFFGLKMEEALRKTA